MVEDLAPAIGRQAGRTQCVARLLWWAATGQPASRAIIAASIFAGLVIAVPVTTQDPEVRALAYNFAWQDGIQLIPNTIQYLNERKQFEVTFLEALAKSDVPATLLWGLHDVVSRAGVANYVWATALKTRSAPASYWLFPCANHYLVHDQANDLAAVMRGELGQVPKPAPST